MPGTFVGPRLAMLLGNQGILFLLYDAFNDTLAAGAVNGTLSTPPPGAQIVGAAPPRTVTDTLSKLSIGSGVVSFAATGNAAGDPGLWYPSQARLLGKTYLGRVTIPATATRFEFGYDATAAGAILDSLRFGTTTVLSAVANGTAVVVGIYAAATYSVALIMRSTGMYYFIKGGAFTNWSLLWQSAVVSAAGLPGLVAESSALLAFTADELRVPLSVFIPTPLAYDTFTRADGALGNSESIGPDAQAVTSRVWTGATFAIATNKAVNTPTLGAELIVNGDFSVDANWTKGAGWTIAAGVASAVIATSNLTTAVGPLLDNIWYQSTYTLSGFGAGQCRGLIGTNAIPAHAVNGTFTETQRSSGTNFAIEGQGGFTGNIDNVSCKALTLSTLLASLQVSTPDVIADVSVTEASGADGKQCGVVINLDSATSPANFVLAFYNGNNGCQVLKCVAGVFSVVINSGVTYSAGAVLRVIKSGTSYSLFYNNLAVGAVATISDAGIINNTLHGLFSTSPLASLDAFQLFGRGSNNEYVGLDSF